MVTIESLRHRDEKKYQALLILGKLFFVITGILTLGLFPLLLLFRKLYYTALLLGNSIKVSEKNYHEVHAIAKDYCQKLQLIKIPVIFIYDGTDIRYSVVNNLRSSQYFSLRSDVVNYLLKEKKMDELSVLIGHELGHHAAKHTDLYDSLYFEFVTSIPIIGTIYSQACEFTADSIALQLTQNIKASQNALIINSQGIYNNIDVEEFIAQEKYIAFQSKLAHKLLSKNARITKRIIELNNIMY